MKITVQVVPHADDDTETSVREAVTVHRDALAPENVGLQVAEARTCSPRCRTRWSPTVPNCGSPTTNGLRLTAFVTNTHRGQLPDLELRHRRRVRCE